MTAPWTIPPPAGGNFQVSAYEGNLVLFAVGGYEPDVNTKFGEGHAVRVAVVILDGQDAGLEVPDALLFQRLLVSRLRGSAGQIVLGRIVKGEARGSNTAPWDLSDPTQQDHDYAYGWYQAYPNRLNELLAGVVESHRVNASQTKNKAVAPQPQNAPQWTGASQPQQAPPQQQQRWNQQPQAYPGPTGPQYPPQQPAGVPNGGQQAHPWTPQQPAQSNEPPF